MYSRFMYVGLWLIYSTSFLPNCTSFYDFESVAFKFHDTPISFIIPKFGVPSTILSQRL